MDPDPDMDSGCSPTRWDYESVFRCGMVKGFDAGTGSIDWDEMDPNAHSVVKDPDPKAGLHSIVHIQTIKE
jgi:hypothetical protein